MNKAVDPQKNTIMKEYEDCCIVIRGLYNEHLKQNVENIRKVYDGEIIYSAWNGAALPELKGVKVVFSEDPGPGPIQSIKRVMFSVINALKETDKSKIFVIRSDVLFTKVPFYLYDENKIYFSSIMSLPMEGFREGAPFGAGASMEDKLPTRFDYNWFCRFGDLFHLGDKKEIIKLFSYFTKAQERHFLQALPRCTEQWMFYRYITEKIAAPDALRDEYDRYIAENIEILNLSDIEGKFTIGVDNHKYDYQYYDKAWHLEYKNKFSILEKE